MIIRLLLIFLGLINGSSICWAEEARVDFKEKIFVVNQDITAIEDSIRGAFVNAHLSVSQSTLRSAGVYFDTPEFSLLDRGGYLRFEAIEYRSKKKNKIKFHETVQYSTVNNPFYQLDVKHYRSVKTFEGKHPLIGLIKRKQRPNFLRALKSDGFMSPLRFKEIAKVIRAAHVLQIKQNGLDLATLTVSQISSTVFDKEIEFNTVSLKYDQASYDEEKISELSALLRNTLNIDDIDIYNNEYSALYAQLESRIAFFKWLLNYPFLVNLLYSLLVGLVGVLFISLILKRREKGRLET